jgi:hypothetical protein
LLFKHEGKGQTGNNKGGKAGKGMEIHGNVSSWFHGCCGDRVNRNFSAAKL